MVGTVLHQGVQPWRNSGQFRPQVIRNEYSAQASSSSSSTQQPPDFINRWRKMHVASGLTMEDPYKNEARSAPVLRSDFDTMSVGVSDGGHIYT